MKKTHIPLNASLNTHSKDTSHSTQLKNIFSFLQNNVATASMVSNATGVPQKCITRYKRDLENKGLLWEIEKKDCLFTGYKAWYITCDPSKAPKKERQLNLFDSPSLVANKEVQEPTIYELQLRIVEPGYTEYLVFENCAFEGVLKIVPQKNDGFIAESIVWAFLFKGSLSQCDDFVGRLIKANKQ